jgi:hypothetical protein
VESFSLRSNDFHFCSSLSFERASEHGATIVSDLQGRALKKGETKWRETIPIFGLNVRPRTHRSRAWTWVGRVIVIHIFQPNSGQLRVNY